MTKLQSFAQSTVWRFSRPIGRQERFLLAAIFIGAGALLLSGLGREFLGGLEGQTVARVAAGFSFDQLAYWPYYGLVWLVDLLVSDSLLAARLVSGLLAWLTLINFWLIVGHFHRSYFALAGLVFLLVNSWFLQLGQTANPEIFSLALLSGGIAWLGFYSAHRNKYLFVVGLSLVLFLGSFLPLICWLLVPAWVLALKYYFKRPTFWPLLAFLAVSLAVNLFFINQNWSAWEAIFGFSHLAGGQNLINSLVDSLAAIFWQAPATAGFSVANLPMLDFWGLSLVCFGLISLLNRLSQERLWPLLGSLLAFLVLLASLGGPLAPGYSLVILPITYLAIAGLVYLWRLWRQVFPANPLAANVGLFAIILLFIFSAAYQLTIQFIVWPRYLA